MQDNLRKLEKEKVSVHLVISIALVMKINTFVVGLLQNEKLLRELNAEKSIIDEREKEAILRLHSQRNTKQVNILLRLLSQKSVAAEFVISLA